MEEVSPVVQACVILYNMIATKRGYQGTMRFRIEMDNGEQAHSLQLGAVMTPECRHEEIEAWRTLFDDIEDVEDFQKLTFAMIDHI